jgi:type IX secretion system PorP/SprF family membrane protein
MMNGFIINPAMAGYDGLTSFNLTTRKQWLGLDNSPQTFTLCAQTRILMRKYAIKHVPNKSNQFVSARRGRVGLGMILFNDKNGNFIKSGVGMTYAYHIYFGDAQLSFGLTGSINQYKISPDNLIFRNTNDEPRIAQGLYLPVYVPDAATGIYYMNRDLYAGFSVSQLFQSNIQFGTQALTAYRLKRQYNLMASYRITQRGDFFYEPSLLIKSTEQFFTQADFSFKMYYREKYWVGMSYRTTNTLIVFIGVQKSKYLFGYAYDYSFNSLQTYTYGSHEFTIAAKFGDTARRYSWQNRY